MSRRPRLPQRRVVALLVETSNAFSREVLHGVRDWMRAHASWAIHLSEQGRGGQPPSWLRDWRGDGIIARIENQVIAKAVRASGVPVVNVSASGLAPELPAVISDSAAIAQMAASHLMECGLRSFGYCGDARFAWSRRHGEHFASTVRAAGHRCLIFPTTRADFTDRKREQAKLAQWLATLPQPAGVMTCYDIRGQQVLDACRVLGLRVPEQVAVIGQHNDELLCELCDPPLSSVIPNARRVGLEAARILDRLMRGQRVAARIVEIPPVGVALRASTDLVAVADPRLTAAIRFIRGHKFDQMTVADIARAAGMSRTLLERSFRALVGTPVWEHVLGLRLQAAEQLLTQSALPIAEIAERTGFGTPEHFSATCRRLRGQSPRQLRAAKGTMERA
jgi:LacI family transcriptional regulator